MSWIGWIQCLIGCIIGVAATWIVGVKCIHEGDRSLRKTSAEMTEIFKETSESIIREMSEPKLVMKTPSLRQALRDNSRLETAYWSVVFTLKNEGLAPCLVDKVSIVTDDPDALELCTGGRSGSFGIELLPEPRDQGHIMLTGEERTFILDSGIDMSPLGTFNEVLSGMLKSQPGHLMLEASYARRTTLLVDDESFRHLRLRLQDLLKARNS